VGSPWLRSTWIGIPRPLRFLKKNAVPFRIVYDPKGDMAKAYKVEAMPSSFLFDRSGRQRAAHQGFRESERVALETQILDLLAESPPDSTSPDSTSR